MISTANTDYIGGIEYDGTSPTTETVSFIQTEEGRAIPNGATAYTYEYNLADHLGDTRLSFDYYNSAARVDQQDNYLPYGMDMSVGTVLAPKNEYLYNKKELQENTQLYDYGARFYDPVIGRWTTIDPLAEKYQVLSPYNYVANDPIKNLDPDGKKIIFAPGVTIEYKKEFTQTVKYLNAHGAGAMLARLQTRKEVILIGSASKGSKYSNGEFSPSAKQIFWDSHEGVKTDNDVRLSPASVLNHEIDHALDAVTNPGQHMENSKPGSDTQYGTKEERRVITGSEQETAKKLGETKDGEVTRTDHNGSSFYTNSPTSNKEAPRLLEEVIITPKKQNK